MHVSEYVSHWVKSVTGAIFGHDPRPLAFRDTLPDQSPPPRNDVERDTVPDLDSPDSLVPLPSTCLYVRIESEADGSATCGFSVPRSADGATGRSPPWHA